MSNETYEAIEYIILKNSIENIPVSTFSKLLDLRKGQKYENYVLKDFFPNSGIVVGHRKNKNQKEEVTLIECVSKYYNVGQKDNDICYDIVEKIGLDYNDVRNCTTCHKKCLELLTKKDIKRK